MFRMLETRSLSYTDGPVPVPADDPFLIENVQRICICDTGVFLSEAWVYICFWPILGFLNVTLQMNG